MTTEIQYEREASSAFSRFESFRSITQPRPERLNETGVARMSRRCAPQARPDGEMRGIPGSRGAPPRLRAAGCERSAAHPGYEPRHRLTAILYQDEVGGLSSRCRGGGTFGK